MTESYDDIINMPHWDPKNHKRMPMGNRAAQFAPFAALTGHDEAIRETARLTDQQQDLDAESARLLDEKLSILISNIGQQPEIEVTYFKNDTRKDGGSYTVYKGRLRKIDEVENTIIFTDGMSIPITSITNISGELLADIDLLLY